MNPLSFLPLSSPLEVVNNDDPLPTVWQDSFGPVPLKDMEPQHLSNVLHAVSSRFPLATYKSIPYAIWKRAIEQEILRRAEQAFQEDPSAWEEYKALRTETLENPSY
jgi:hypothetical protein